MVPGLREELCRTLLRALPRAIRKQLMPIEPKAAEVAARFEPGRADFLPALAAYLKKTYRVEVAGSDWPVDPSAMFNVMDVAALSNWFARL